MRIYVDTREKPRAIVGILRYFEQEGIEVLRQALPTADYKDPDHPLVLVDRKQNLNEVVNNLVHQRPRFLREVDRATRNGHRLIVLVEHSSRIKTLEDVIGWTNPRLKVSPYAVSGERLYKIMRATAEHYGFEWAFCDKAHTGQKIIELLKLGADND